MSGRWDRRPREGGRPGGCEGGFTLLEIIAVLAILSIMAGVITPNIVQSISSAKRQAEEGNLAALARALAEGIEETRLVPDSTSWAAALAAQASLPVSRIAGNDAGYARVYLSHPDFFAAGEGLPAGGYSQDAVLQNNRGPTDPPATPRIMILSHLAGPLPATAVSAALFDQIWSQSGQPAAWTEGPMLLIRRVDLGSQFHQVSFNREPSSKNHPSILIGSHTLTLRPGQANATYYLLEGTTLQFYDGTGNLENTQVVREARSFTYKSPDWLGTWD